MSREPTALLLAAFLITFVPTAHAMFAQACQTTLGRLRGQQA